MTKSGRGATESLRNRYYKKRAPLEKRLAELEVELPRNERELHEANLLLSDPEHYSDAALVMETVERKKATEARIEALTQEWERVFAHLEEARSDYELQRGHATSAES